MPTREGTPGPALEEPGNPFRHYMTGKAVRGLQQMSSDPALHRVELTKSPPTRTASTPDQ